MSLVDISGQIIDMEALDKFSRMFQQARGVIGPAVQYVGRRSVLEKELDGVDTAVARAFRQDYIAKLNARLNALDKSFSDRYVTEFSNGDVLLYTTDKGGFTVGVYAADNRVVHMIDAKKVKGEAVDEENVLCVMEDTLSRGIADEDPLIIMKGETFLVCGFAEAYNNRLCVKRWPGDVPVRCPSFDQAQISQMTRVSPLVMKLRGFDIEDGPYR